MDYNSGLRLLFFYNKIQSSLDPCVHRWMLRRISWYHYRLASFGNKRFLLYFHINSVIHNSFKLQFKKVRSFISWKVRPQTRLFDQILNLHQSLQLPFYDVCSLHSCVGPNEFQKRKTRTLRIQQVTTICHVCYNFYTLLPVHSLECLAFCQVYH